MVQGHRRRRKCKTQGKRRGEPRGTKHREKYDPRCILHASIIPDRDSGKSEDAECADYSDRYGAWRPVYLYHSSQYDAFYWSIRLGEIAGQCYSPALALLGRRSRPGPASGSNRYANRSSTMALADLKQRCCVWVWGLRRHGYLAHWFPFQGELSDNLRGVVTGPTDHRIAEVVVETAKASRNRDRRSPSNWPPRSARRRIR